MLNTKDTNLSILILFAWLLALLWSLPSRPAATSQPPVQPPVQTPAEQPDSLVDSLKSINAQLEEILDLTIELRIKQEVEQRVGAVAEAQQVCY